MAGSVAILPRRPARVLQLSPLIDLPASVVVHVLICLAVRDVAAVAAACRKLHGVAALDAVWRPLFEARAWAFAYAPVVDALPLVTGDPVRHVAGCARARACDGRGRC